MLRHRGGDQDARQALIERYLPLARSLALRYRHTSEPLDDLVQVASLGLVKAAERWDPDRGTAFSSFAVPTILGELRRYFRDSTWIVRPPRDSAELSRSIDRARGSLDAMLGREPTTSDLAAHFGCTPEAIREALRAGECRRIRSLDSPVGGEPSEPVTVGDTIGDDEPGYEHAEARASFEHLMSTLDPKAREILRLRFADDLIQARIAERIGCSQIHVSRIVRASLERIAARVASTGPLVAPGCAPL